jgi:hypothetical protein
MSIQKGFWPGVDGVSEHSELLTHVMRDAKRYQRTVVVTLLDLRNAFGEVHHNLIRKAMEYHHVAPELIEIFNGIYCNFCVTIAVNNSWTEPVVVERGVLQGDPASPLLFNLCFNTLMNVLKTPDYSSLGYIWGATNRQQHCQWLQFADDAAIVSRNVEGTQALLNTFVAWCLWAGMDLRLDKCCTFGMSKKEQFLWSISARSVGK